MPQRLIQKGLKCGERGGIRSGKKLLKKFYVIFSAFVHENAAHIKKGRISMRPGYLIFQFYFFLT